MARLKGYKKEMPMGLKMAKYSVYPQMAKPKDSQTVTMMASPLTDLQKEYLLTVMPKDYDHLTGLQMENCLEIQTDFPMAKKMASLQTGKHWAMLMARNLENLMDSPMAKTMAFLPMAKRMDYDLVNQMANCWVIHLANWKDSPMGM